MQYPNRIQAALLLDTPLEGLDAVTRDLARVFEMKTGSRLTISEHHPGAFMRLFDSADSLMLTFEYLGTAPEPGVFTSALASAVTTIYAPDMAERVRRARGMILLEVSHGVLGEPETHPALAAATRPDAALPGDGDQMPGALAAFHQRLETLALMARVASDHIKPVAVHWTQCDQLLLPDTFEAFAGGGFPGPLTLHPLLFGEAGDGDVPETHDKHPFQVGLRTFGARHWLGREIVVPPSAPPWDAAYETVLAYCAYAALPDATPIPDGDTFGPPPAEEGEESGEIWRVHHRGADPTSAGNDDGDATGGPAPVTQLVPLRHDACGFVADEYARSARVLAERAPKETGDISPDPEDTGGEDTGGEDTGGEHSASEADTTLAALRAALEEGRAEAAARMDEDPADQNAAHQARSGPQTGTPSLPGDTDISGRSLRKRLFGNKKREG